MEVDHIDDDNLSAINSFQLNKALHIGIVELSRKRKLQEDQLGLPSPKHKCSFLAKPAVIFNKNGVGREDSSEISESEISVENESEAESAKSNSFAGDSDCVMSGYSESKYDQGTSSSENTFVYENEIAFMTEEDHYNELQALNVLGDPLLEFESRYEYICSQHSNENKEQSSDTMLDDDVLYSNEKKQNTYVLSSGRWNVNQDTQNEMKKPTIDQEFEQYFSTLML
ncbi:hypothetical protein ACFE04_000609 [Oxalis oulophora]